jgi:hypothetical protein
MELSTLKTNRVLIPFPKFKCDGFSPREEFKRKAYMILEDIIGRIPGDARFTAECKKRFGKYYFKIAVNGSSANFEATTVLDPREEDCSNRDWLNKAIEGLHNSMNIQLQSWLQTRQLNC